ncbi:hypothetical protein DX933_00630 [Ornithinibacillus gellani]|uniref:hypothetical protein n=1 Tax=Ornithinibacillus gellani TaxID=2293253 RepID=UPI000F47CDF3|nr:hypothetical protein [Ornithinibacillus gellani]TQS76641.1 hypothetical protein DX933_00630 [Ornithinibacillus gellani]
MRHIAEEDYQLMSRFLFLSMAIVVMEQDMHHFQQGIFKIKEPYIKLLGQMLVEAKQQRKQLRQTMNNGNMHVSILNRNDSFSSYLFRSKGLEEKRNYFNPAIRKKVEGIMQDLMLVTKNPSTSS